MSSVADFNPSITPSSGGEGISQPQGEGKAQEAPQAGGNLTHTFTPMKGEQSPVPQSVTSSMYQGESAEEKFDSLLAKQFTKAADKAGRQQDQAAESERRAGGSEDIIPIHIILQNLKIEKAEKSEEIEEEEEEDEEEEGEEEKEGEDQE